jgi:hypothetical protein
MKVEASAVIARPPDEVFALAADPTNDPLWASTVAEARQTSEGPIGVGTTYAQVLRLLRRRLEITFEVTGYEPNRLLEIGHFSGRLRSAVGRRTFEPAPGGTRVTFAGEGTSGLFLNLLEPCKASPVFTPEGRNRYQIQYQVLSSLPQRTTTCLRKTRSVQGILGRSGVGVEPTHRWATPVSPVLKVCYERSI